MNLRNTGERMGMRQRLRYAASLALVAVVALIANLLLSPTVGATSICQWVDKNGKMQFSDVVPETYKSIVTCTHTTTTETPADQRAGGEKSKKRRDSSSPPATAASTVTPPQSPASQPAPKQPVERVTDSTDCKTWRRLFDESGACFSPFRTARGGIKAEAFAACNEVPNPEAKCGPQTN